MTAAIHATWWAIIATLFAIGFLPGLFGLTLLAFTAAVATVTYYVLDRQPQTPAVGRAAVPHNPAHGYVTYGYREVGA